MTKYLRVIANLRNNRPNSSVPDLILGQFCLHPSEPEPDSPFNLGASKQYFPNELDSLKQELDHMFHHSTHFQPGDELYDGANHNILLATRS